MTINCIFNHENKFNDFRNCADPKALWQGTVNLTSYNVIEDNSGIKPDHI